MTLHQIWQVWYSIFFKKQSCLPIALFRIFIGLCVLNSVVLAGPDFMTWFGSHGWVATDFDAAAPKFDLRLALGRGEHSLLAIYWILVVSSITLTLGLFSRFSAFVVWIAMLSLNNYDPWAYDSGEGLRRICAFFLIFAPSGNLLSLDRYIARRWRGDTRSDDELMAAPWVQRLLQLQTTCIYWQAFWGKVPGAAWQDGTALYYVLHLHQLARIQIPFLFDNLLICKLCSWATLVLEFALWALIWVKEFRYPILIAGLLLHIGIDVTINVPVFEWVMMSMYILFVDEKDIRAFGAFLRSKVSPVAAKPSVAS